MWLEDSVGVLVENVIDVIIVTLYWPDYLQGNLVELSFKCAQKVQCDAVNKNIYC